MGGGVKTKRKHGTDNTKQKPFTQPSVKIKPTVLN
jgi:hypothetical protein